MKRIAELGGKLGYLVIMSKSEKDNKSRRVQATLSRSDCSLGRIRTNWILMRHVLVECKKPCWKASKTPQNSNFISNRAIQIQTAIPSNIFNKTWKEDKTVPYTGRFILPVCPFQLLMHILRLKGGTFIASINYHLTRIYPAIYTAWVALHPWKSSFHLLETPRGALWPCVTDRHGMRVANLSQSHW